MNPTPAAPFDAISPEERRWLHDKYERLAGDEAELANSRTSYFAAIASALVAALVVLVINELGHPLLFAMMSSLLAGFGILISAVWTVVLHRTTAAQNLWREAALLLESQAGPIATTLPSDVPIRGGRTIRVDLTRPYRAHQTRFAPTAEVPWIDRVNPSEVSENVPLTLAVLWTVVVVGTWVWYFSVV